jgi:hypothetical protein
VDREPSRFIGPQMMQGQWSDSERGKVKLADYAAKWIDQRAGCGRCS